MLPPTALEPEAVLLSSANPRFYTVPDVLSEAPGRLQWVRAASAGVAFAVLGALCVLGATQGHRASESTALQVASVLQVVPQPHMRVAAFGRQTRQTRLQSARHPEEAAVATQDDPQEVLQAADAALVQALDKAEVILTWVLGPEAKGMTMDKAQQALRRLDGLVEQRKAAATAAANQVQALDLVAKAEKKQQMIRDVITAMLLKAHAEQAVGAAPPSSSARPRSPPQDSPHTELEDPQKALMAANAAVDKALDRAEAILMWLLEANVKGITLEKAERALQMTEEQVEKRRAAAKTAVDPLQAEALVEKTLKEQELVSQVVAALRLKRDAEGALARATGRAAQPLPAAAAQSTTRQARPAPRADDPEQTVRAAGAAVDRALERAEAVLTWVLGDEAKDMDVAKAQRALKVIDALVEKRRAATKAAADPVQALALVEKAEKKRGLLQELVSALLLQQEAEGALRQR